MGLDLTWRTEDRKVHGNCGQDLQTLVQLNFPDAPSKLPEGFIATPEMSTSYVIYQPSNWMVKEMDIPKGRSGYAIEFTRLKAPLSRDEIEARLRENFSRNLPKELINDPETEKFIKKRVESYFDRRSLESFGLSFVEGMQLEDGKAFVTVYRFIRWVSKEEYQKKARELVFREGNDEEGVWSFNRWEDRFSKDGQQKCKTCPLNTRLSNNPYVDMLERRLHGLSLREQGKILHGVYKELIPNKDGHTSNGLFHTLLENKGWEVGGVLWLLADRLKIIPGYENHAKKVSKFMGENGYRGDSLDGCNRGSMYSHFSEFFTFIKQYGEFEILTDKYLEKNEGVPVEKLPQLEEELTRSRHILESLQTKAMSVYDLNGKLISTYPQDMSWLYGNEFRGYGVGLEGDAPGISVVCQGKSIFDVPVEQRREVLNEHGLEGAMVLCKVVDSQNPRLVVKSIERSGNTYIAHTVDGQTVELPPIKDPEHNTIHTPFSFVGSAKEKTIGKIVYSTTSPMDGFGFLQRLFEKHAKIGKEFNIPIEGR